MSRYYWIVALSWHRCMHLWEYLCHFSLWWLFAAVEELNLPPNGNSSSPYNLKTMWVKQVEVVKEPYLCYSLRNLLLHFPGIDLLWMLCYWLAIRFSKELSVPDFTFLCLFPHLLIWLFLYLCRKISSDKKPITCLLNFTRLSNYLSNF